MAKIKAGEPVGYDHVIIKGNLSLGQLGLETTPFCRGLSFGDDNLSSYDPIGSSTVYHIGNLTKIPSTIIITNSIINDNLEFDYAIFQNNIDFRETKFNGSVNFASSLLTQNSNFESSQFSKAADFTYSRFNGKVSFVGSQFSGKADFFESEFSKGANFWGSDFRADTDFRISNFSGNTCFINSKFGGKAGFSRSQFNGPSDFEKTKFNGDAYFWDSGFSKDASFVGSEFSEYADFTASKFSGNALFRDSEFNGNTAFIRSQFKELSDFNFSRFNGNAYFWNSQFGKDAHFWYSKFSGDASFSGSQFNKSANFNNSIFNKIADFPYSNFGSHSIFNECKFNKDANFRASIFKDSIQLKDIDFDRIYLDWDKIEKVKKNFDGKVYLSLIESYKARGFFNDADDCYRRFRIDQLMQQSVFENPLTYLIDFGGWIFYGYGTRPDLPIIWSILVITSIGLFFWRNTLSKAKKANQGLISAEDWFCFSAAVFLSGTKFFVDPPKVPKPLEEPNPWIRRVFIAERILGALFSILLILAISRTLIR